MTEPLRPAYSRDSILVQLPQVETITELTPEWAWGGASGAGVRVAVVDSGIDATHPDLHGCVDIEQSARVELDDQGQPTIAIGPHDDSFGHGTACAGIIHQLAPEARITSVKVLGASLSGTSEVFHAGLQWAVEQRFDVINLSLGSRKRDWALPFHDLCDQAYFNGSFLTTAANNIERVTYPSLFASVASVASNMTRDPYRFHHNPEPPTEFLARGIDVEVPWLEHGRIVTTGNSFAAPHIAGLATLIRSKHPGLRPFQIKTILWATSANVIEASQRAGRLSRVLRPGEAVLGRSTRALRVADLAAPPVAGAPGVAGAPPVAGATA
jgi:subtilisin family serine protease